MAAPTIGKSLESVIPIVQQQGLNTAKASNFSGLTIDTSGNLTAPASSTVDLSAATTVKLPASVVVTATPDFTPASDATNAFEFTNAADTAIVLDIDTTNQRIGIGNGAATPGYTLDVQGSSAANCQVVIKSSNATAFAVGLNGATNPAVLVDSSTVTSATGLKIKSAAAAGGLALSVLSSTTNENLTIDAKGSGTITLNGTGTGAIKLQQETDVTGILTVTNNTNNAFIVGPNGVTNPTLQVDPSTVSAATGLNIKSAAAAGGIALSVISSTTNENMTIDGKGSGSITLNGTATGNVISGANFQMTDAKNVVLGTTTGSKIGTATNQKLGFFNATPVVQQSTTGGVATTAAGSTTTVFVNTTFTGGVGATAYTVADIITALKNLGLLAS